MGGAAGAPGPERVIREDARLRVLHLPGAGDTLVVAFTGVGQVPGALQTEEFRGSGSAGGRNHVLFVTDRLRSWFTAPGLWEEIAAHVAAVRAAAGARRLVTLGNSMGGFGALQLARHLPLDAAIAFVPQFSMDDRLVPDPRWQGYKRALADPAAATLSGCWERIGAAWILHGSGGHDARHWPRFPTGPAIHHALLPGAGHGAAAELKAKGRLGPFVEAAVAGETARATAELAAAGAVLRRTGTRPETAWLHLRLGLARGGAALARRLPWRPRAPRPG